MDKSAISLELRLNADETGAFFGTDAVLAVAADCTLLFTVVSDGLAMALMAEVEDFGFTARGSTIEGDFPPVFERGVFTGALLLGVAAVVLAMLLVVVLLVADLVTVAFITVPC